MTLNTKTTQLHLVTHYFFAPGVKKWRLKWPKKALYLFFFWHVSVFDTFCSMGKIALIPAYNATYHYEMYKFVYKSC